MTEAPKKRAKPNSFLGEADVTRQIRDFLAYRGWREHRLNAGKWVPWAEAMRYANRSEAAYPGSEAGAKPPVPRDWGDKSGPDWLFVHPARGAFYVEIKAEGKKPRKDQLQYLSELVCLGFSATWTNDLDQFADYYRSRWGEGAA